MVKYKELIIGASCDGRDGTTKPKFIYTDATD